MCQMPGDVAIVFCIAANFSLAVADGMELSVRVPFGDADTMSQGPLMRHQQCDVDARAVHQHRTAGGA